MRPTSPGVPPQSIHPLESTWIPVLILVLLTGCATPLRVTPTTENIWFDQMHNSALLSDTLSEPTRWFLYQRELEAEYKKDPAALIAALDRDIVRETGRDAFLALAEICYEQAQKQHRKKDLSSRLSMSCVRYAYAYLFETGLTPQPDLYSPRFRMACDLYNRSLARLIQLGGRHAQAQGTQITLPMIQGTVNILTSKSTASFDLNQFTELLDVYQLKVRGVAHIHRNYGIGAPLAAVHRTASPEGGADPDARIFLPDLTLSYSATAVLRFPDPIAQQDPANVQAVFELYDTTRHHAIEIGGRRVPLEADYTTPLAYQIEQRQEDYSGFFSMLFTGSAESKRGMMMMQPYDPHKIPVIFIHGLMSYPQTWIPMVNTLLGDNGLHQQYQFWFYRYPTGYPLMYSAMQLRETLQTMRRVLDPEGDDPAFDHTVLIGHSMGGVLTRLMVQSSGGELWRKIMPDNPAIEELNARPEVKDLLGNMIHYEPVPFVQRIIMIAAPHRGSQTASGFFGRMGNRLISLPRSFIAAGEELLTTLRLAGRPKDELKRTGISSLSSRNRALQVTADMPIAPGVTYHSIMGNNREAGLPGGTDGLVSYESSHLEGAASESIYHSQHDVHANQLAISEVRRILLDHLEENRDLFPETAKEEAQDIGRI
ncbi:MAG: esterase/lipase family protein [bacterium]